MKRCFTVLALVVLVGCGGWWPPIPNPNPTPTPTPTPTPPPHTEECQALLDDGYEWAQPGTTCGKYVHNPTSDPRHCEALPECTEPLPQPQCEEGQCDCYKGEDYFHCENETCKFPQGIDNEFFTGVPNPGTYGSVVNKAMAELSGCAVGTDCPITFHPDKWMGLVCEVLCVEYGLNCGRHDDTPPGATDQISVKKGDFCDGKLHENYQIYNYGGKKVRWAPGGTQDAWLVDCDEGMPPPVDPPSDVCPNPPPNMDRMKFTKKESGNHMDTTLITIYQPDFCASIGYCCMPNTGVDNQCGSPGCTPRGGCPVLGDGHPDRAACEMELCNQKWTCNGEPYPGWRGNVAQTDCRGHYVTWCENAPNVRLEGDR